MQFVKIPEVRPVPNQRRRRRYGGKRLISRPQRQSESESDQGFYHQRSLHYSLCRRAEDLAGLGAWTCASSELAPIVKTGNLITENETRSTDTSKYRAIHQDTGGVTKQMELKAHVQKEARRSKASLLGRYLLETEHHNLPTQERFMRVTKRVIYGTTRESRRIVLYGQ